MIARVVELEDPNARDDHLDAIDRVFLSVRLERMYGRVKHGARASAKRGDELVARVRRVGEADARDDGVIGRNELGNLVAGDDRGRQPRSQLAMKSKTYPASLAGAPRASGVPSQIKLGIPDSDERTILQY